MFLFQYSMTLHITTVSSWTAKGDPATIPMLLPISLPSTPCKHILRFQLYDIKLIHKALLGYFLPIP